MTPLVQHHPVTEHPTTADRGARITKAEATGGAVHEGNVKLVPWLMMMAIFSGFALATSVLCYIYLHDVHQADRDEIVVMKNDLIRFRVQLMSRDALMIREGILKEGDMWEGPEANLEYGHKDQPRQRR